MLWPYKLSNKGITNVYSIPIVSHNWCWEGSTTYIVLVGDQQYCWQLPVAIFSTSSAIPIYRSDTIMTKISWVTALALADLGGGGACRAHAIPYGTQFFHFHIHFHQKAPASEVHTPSNGCMPPLWEILDPPLPGEQLSFMLSSCWWCMNSGHESQLLWDLIVLIKIYSPLTLIFWRYIKFPTIEVYYDDCLLRSSKWFSSNSTSLWSGNQLQSNSFRMCGCCTGQRWTLPSQIRSFIIQRVSTQWTRGFLPISQWPEKLRSTWICWWSS